MVWWLGFPHYGEKTPELRDSLRLFPFSDSMCAVFLRSLTAGLLCVSGPRPLSRRTPGPTSHCPREPLHATRTSCGSSGVSLCWLRYNVWAPLTDPRCSKSWDGQATGPSPSETPACHHATFSPLPPCPAWHLSLAPFYMFCLSFAERLVNTDAFTYGL